ncbi:hypothetical protein [Chlorogloeopsis sp. ULAP02]|uniref:hypothetical protein n=1 Tax=Chlorogloeopsis sp. ULAP02 TaxID=3107926 RepID=UPI003136A57F
MNTGDWAEQGVESGNSLLPVTGVFNQDICRQTRYLAKPLQQSLERTRCLPYFKFKYQHDLPVFWRGIVLQARSPNF